MKNTGNEKSCKGSEIDRLMKLLERASSTRFTGKGSIDGQVVELLIDPGRKGLIVFKGLDGFGPLLAIDDKHYYR
jgi:hypothetical protein